MIQTTTSAGIAQNTVLPAVLSRQLEDRIEKYSDILHGECSCGQPIDKVLGSSCTMWKNGDRYHVPENKTAWGLFRCPKCGEPVHETFRSSAHGR